MSMNVKSSLFLLPILLLATSCEKVIEPKDLPEQDPRIVVNAIFSTSSYISANISQSKSIVSGKDYKYFSNAVCEVYEDDNYLQTLTYQSNGNYYTPVLPKAGRRYTIRVSASGFESVNAETTLPGDLDIFPLEITDTTDLGFRREPWGPDGGTMISGTLKLKLRIRDTPGQSDYYSIVPHVQFLDSLDQPLTYTTTVSIVSYNNSGNLGGEEYFDTSMDFTDDNTVNGNEVQRLVGVQIRQADSFGKPTVKSIRVQLEVQHQSADYYKYKKTLLDQVIMGPNFFAEPVQVYTNINKGMGILAGVNSTLLPVYTGIVKEQ